MAQILETREKYLLLVAADNWRERIEHELAEWMTEIRWHPNVYEAVATAIELKRRGETALVVILIDSLAAEEMQVFSTLARIGSVRTAAVSTGDNRFKLNQARIQGADEALVLRDLPLLGPRPGVRGKKIKEPQARPGVLNDPIKNTAGESVDESPAKMAPPADDSTKTRLSREELDALLG